MKELITNGIAGESLKVFPHLPEDTPDERTAAIGCVEALPYWNDGGAKIWGVQLNISYDLPMTREKSDQLQAAINRCWQWIDEQSAAAKGQA